MLRRRRKQTLAELWPVGDWTVSVGEYGGRPLFARFHATAGSASDRKTFPIQIGVATLLVDPDERGLPKEPEFAQLDEIEDIIQVEAGDRAFLVGVITTGSMREFVLYTAAADWVEGFHRRLEEVITHHEITVMAQADPRWKTYRRFLPRR